MACDEELRGTAGQRLKRGGGAEQGAAGAAAEERGEDWGGGGEECERRFEREMRKHCEHSFD